MGQGGVREGLGDTLLVLKSILGPHVPLYGALNGDHCLSCDFTGSPSKQTR